MNKLVSMRSGKRYLFSVVALLMSVGFYAWFSQLPDSRPLFLLRPITDIVSGFTSLRFLWKQDAGFMGMTRGGYLFVINKSCSGGVFLTICFSLLALTQVPRFSRRRTQALALVIFSVFSYISAITASVLRIIPSIVAFDMKVGLSPVLIHNALGMVTFITLICSTYLLVNFLVTKTMEKDGEIIGKEQ